MRPSRRELLCGAASAAGARWLPTGAPQEAGESGLVTGEPRALAYSELPGFLSKEQLRWHHDSHYGGALKKFKQLDAAVTGTAKAVAAKANSVILHELYFDNMTPGDSDPTELANDALAARFGSLESWLADFRAAALSSRGWAVLAWQPVNGRLYNIATDSHSDGPLWFGVPLAVIDMYEHAYYIDFQNRKSDYVEGFLEHVNWAAIDRRLRATRG